MRSAYKSPVLWITVAVGLAFAVLGQILTHSIQSDWKYLFFNMTPGGLMMAVFLTLCSLANFVGTRFCVDKEFTKWLPSQLIVITAIVAVSSLFAAMALGGESKAALWILSIGAGGLVLSVPAAFFIRGMAPQTANDH